MMVFCHLMVTMVDSNDSFGSLGNSDWYSERNCKVLILFPEESFPIQGLVR